MTKRYRVTQYLNDEAIHSATYRFRWMALFSAWVHSGPALFRSWAYTTTLAEEHDD